MVLAGVTEENKWLVSAWILTYKVGWDKILKACASCSENYHEFEILVDKKLVPIKTNEEIMKLEEAQNLTFRGLLKNIGAGIMITLYNQSDLVDVYVTMTTEEFSSADYETFNKTLGGYLDSIELAMYI